MPRLRQWLARRLAAIATWLVHTPQRPTRQASAPGLDTALALSGGHFKITQRVGEVTTVVYRGDQGSLARRTWEQLCASRPSGTLRFLHNGVERGRYPS